MYLAQTLLRARSDGDVEQICQFYRTAVEPAMMHNGGFIKATCGSDLADRLLIVLDEHWGSLGALQWWQNSAERRQLLHQIQAWLAGPAQSRIYQEIM